MRIAIDYRILTLLPAWRTRGIPRYTQQQLREVVRLDRDNEYLVLTPRTYAPEQMLPEIASAPNVSLRPFVWSEAAGGDVTAPAPRFTLRRTEEFQQWLVRERVDVFHSPTPWFQTETIFPAIDVCPTVTALYDLIPLLFPEEFGLADAFWDRLYATLPWSTRLLAISDATRHDAERLLQIPASRVDIAYPVADPAYGPLPADEVERRLAALRSRGLPAGFLLTVTFVGGATKNVELLLQAFAALPPAMRREHPLVIVGHFGPPGDARVRALMDQLGISDVVIVLGVIPDETLAALYNAATLVAIASRYEGFGMPLLEAMQCGAPVLASTSSSMPEVVGGAGALVPPDEPEGFTQAIADIVSSRARQDEMRAAGFVQARHFTAERLARATVDCYARAAADGRATTATDRTERHIAIWADVPPQLGEGARRGATMLESLKPRANVELFVADEDLPAPEVMRDYRVHHHGAFERRHAQARFDAVIFEARAHRLSAAVGQVEARFPDLRVFGTSGARRVRPGVRDPLGLRPDLEREIARSALGVTANTFVVGLAYDLALRDGALPTIDGPIDVVLDAIAALTRGVIDVRLVIAIDADSQRALEAAVRAHHLSQHALWITPRSVEQADDHLLACDAVVAVGGATPPATLANALAAARAIVCVGAVWPCVSGAACWRVDDPADASAIEQALTTIGAEPVRRASMERAARACFEEHFTLDAMADAYCAEIDRDRPGARDRTPAAPAPAIGGAPTILRFNKACEWEDFSHPELSALIRDTPEGALSEHGRGAPAWDRKQWEVAMAIRTLQAFGAVRPDATLLGVAAGMEDTIYRLAPLVREMTVVDRYLQPGEWDSFAAPWMTVAPEFGARRRPGHDAPPSASNVRAAHMDMRELRFADNTFDGIFSSGSIEHVGGLQDIAHAAYEMGRVLKPGGVLSVSTELLLRGPADPDVVISGNMILLRRAQICRYIIDASGLEPVDDLVVDISPSTKATRQAIGHAFGRYHERTIAVGLRAAGWSDRLWARPYLVLEHQGYLFGSVHVALRKPAAYPVSPNAWARPTSDVAAGLAVQRRELVAALGGWGAPVASLTPRRRGAGRIAAAVARAEAKAHESYVMCHAAREAMATVTSELRRVERELPGSDASAAEQELARLREEVRRLATRTAEIERRSLGWRMLTRGLLTVLSPSPAPVGSSRPPEGMRRYLLSIGRRFKPVARRLPRLAASLRRWIYTG